MYERSFEWIDDEKTAKRRMEVDTVDDVVELEANDCRMIFGGKWFDSIGL